MAEPLDEIEELTLCPRCRRPFDEAERAPKLLACHHHFCLACARGALGRGRELYCALCWKRTEPPEGRAERLPTHRPVLALARRLRACLAPAPGPACALHAPPAPPAPWCRACLLAELRRLAARRRDFLLRARAAAAALEASLEDELAAPPPPPPTGAHDHDLRARVAEAALRCRLDDVVCAATRPLDADAVRRALAAPPSTPPRSPHRPDPLLFLGNLCAAARFARHWREWRAEAEADGEGEAEASASTPSACAPSPPLRAHPLFFFELEVNGAPCGRFVVEVRGDVAPRMARNFSALATGAPGAGYRGCAVFQCWANESVITGDFEQNNGRGGRSAFEEAFFMPDDTRLAALRGAVGMRRSQKRRNRLGLVGSQFRVVLREMRGFTAIFAFVVEGLELVDRLARAGDGTGKPNSTILISSCGKLD